MAKKQLTIEEKLQAALVPVEEQPYKVPENWCWVRLGSVTTRIKRGKSPKYVDESDFPVFAQKCNQKDGTIALDKARFLNPDMAMKLSEEEFLHENDVVINSTGTGTLGRVGFFREQDKLGYEKILPDSHVTVVRPSTIVENFFLYLFLKGKQSFLELQGAGSTNQKELRPATISELMLPLPPQGEQSRIVARIESLFAKLDEAKEKIQEVLDGADLRRAAILHQAFTGKLTEKWRRENGVSNESWEDKSIKEISIPRAGVAFDSKKFSTKGYQVIRMGNLYNGELDLSRNPVYYPREFLDNKILERALIHNDDILITLTGTKYKRDYGYAVKMVNPEKLLVNQRILCLTAIKEYVLSDYLNYYLQTKLFRDVFFSNETGGVNQGNVSSKFVESIVIKVPLVDEQQEIVRLLDNLLSREQSTVTACEEALTTIDTLKKSILARAFRGELGTNDPSDPSAKELLREILSA